MCKLCAKTRFFVLFYGTNWLFRQLDKYEKTAEIRGFSGGDTGTRTLDPMIKSHLLYQLSYVPKTGPGNKNFSIPFPWVGGNFDTNKNKNQEKIINFLIFYFFQSALPLFQEDSNVLISLKQQHYPHLANLISAPLYALYISLKSACFYEICSR